MYIKKLELIEIHADSDDIKILVQFPGNSFLKLLVIFWNRVGGD